MLRLVVLASALFAAGAASGAPVTVSIDLTDAPGVVMTGDLTFPAPLSATGEAPTAYDIHINGRPATILDAFDTDGLFYDPTVFYGDTVDSYGVEFLSSQGVTYISAIYIDDVVISAPSYLSSLDYGVGLTLAPIPEPASWDLMLIGVAGLGALLRRRPNPLSAA